MRLPEAFTDFHKRIALSTLSEERINRAWGRLHAFHTAEFAIPDSFVYIQGSYANDTAVKPGTEDGEYDLDIVCICVGTGTSAGNAIQRLTSALAGDGDLAKRTSSRTSPVARASAWGTPRTPTASAFTSTSFLPRRQSHRPIEVPMRGQEHWRESAPYAYTRWCQEQPVQFRRAVRFLKRWRDEHGDSSIASIVLQVLTAQHLDASATSDVEAISGDAY